MTVFYEIANLHQTVAPLSMAGVYFNQLFVIVKLAISTFGTLAILVGAVIAIYRYSLFRFRQWTDPVVEQGEGCSKSSFYICNKENSCFLALLFHLNNV